MHPCRYPAARGSRSGMVAPALRRSGQHFPGLSIHCPGPGRRVSGGREDEDWGRWVHEEEGETTLPRFAETDQSDVLVD